MARRRAVKPGVAGDQPDAAQRRIRMSVGRRIADILGCRAVPGQGRRMQSHGVLRGRHGAAFRLDRINLVNPHTIYRTEQTQAVDGIADGDSHQPRSALGVASPPETAAEERHAPAPRRLSRHRTASIAVSLFSAATAPLSPVEHETPEFADQVHIQVTLERGHQIQRVFLAHRPFVGALVDQRRKDVRDGGNRRGAPTRSHPPTRGNKDAFHDLL